MGKSASSCSGMIKDARDHLIVGFSKKQGTFEYDPSLEEYMEDQMRVVRVRRYLDPMKAQGYGFGHEFLVVDLRTSETEDQILIRVEKQFIGLNHEKYQPGGLTNVTRITDPPKFAKEHKDRVKYEVNLQGSGKILMKDLIAILRACNGRYSLWKHNCWKYTYDTLRNLLEEFAGLADTSDDCKKNIREALEVMPRPSLPAETLAEAGSVLLGCFVAGALFYCGAVGTIAAFKYLRGLKMALAAGTTVKGLAGSSLFTLKSSTALAIKSLAERAWVGSVYKAYCVLYTVLVLEEEFASMREKHSCSAKA